MDMILGYPVDQVVYAITLFGLLVLLLRDIDGKESPIYWIFYGLGILSLIVSLVLKGYSGWTG